MFLCLRIYKSIPSRLLHLSIFAGELRGGFLKISEFLDLDILLDSLARFSFSTK